MYPRHLRNWNLELSNEKTDAESNPVIETQVFTGSYENTGDGKSNVQYAFLLLNDDDTIDVVPVGDRAWYFFRARQHRTQTLEEIESKQRKGAVKDEKRLEVLETKLQESQVPTTGETKQKKGTSTQSYDVVTLQLPTLYSLRQRRR